MNENHNAIDEMFNSYSKNAEWEVILKDKKQMRIKITALQHLSKLFESLNELKEQNILKNYWCSVMNLEDIFLSIAKNQKGDEFEEGQEVAMNVL